MKIIEIISDTNTGGAGKLLITRLANRTVGEMDEQVILPCGSDLIKPLEDMGITVHRINGCADKSFDFSAIGEIRKIITANQPDLVNSHGCISGRIAAHFCKVPVNIYTRHCAFDVPLPMRIFPLKQIVGKINSAFCDGIIAVAYAAKENLCDIGTDESKINVIINGVDGLRKYTDEEREKIRGELGFSGCFVIGICARIEKCKDHGCFLRAAKILSQKNGKYRFLIVGDGSLRKETEELAKNLGIWDKVVFTGFSRDVEKYINCFDLQVNCSVGTETSSLALSEGMSLGLPSAVSSFGGNPYMVRHGENGFVYMAGDYFELAMMADKIASDEKLYKNMSASAYNRYLTEFNSKKMTYETEKYYRELYREYLALHAVKQS